MNPYSRKSGDTKTQRWPGARLNWQNGHNSITTSNCIACTDLFANRTAKRFGLIVHLVFAFGCKVQDRVHAPVEAPPVATRGIDPAPPVAQIEQAPIEPEVGPEPALSPAAENRPDLTIFRDELERATDGGNAAYLLQALSPEVHLEKGRFAGWQIGSLFGSDPTLCTECLLKVGDIVEKVNGHTLERPEDLSNLLASIGSVHELCAQIRRKDERIVLAYFVRDRNEAAPQSGEKPCTTSKVATKRKSRRHGSM
jgi:hypothetical protein